MDEIPVRSCCNSVPKEYSLLIKLPSVFMIEFLLIYSIPKPAALHLMTLLYRLDMA